MCQVRVQIALVKYLRLWVRFHFVLIAILMEREQSACVVRKKAVNTHTACLWTVFHIAAKIARSLQRQPEMRKRHLPRLNVFSYRVENPRAARQAIFCEQ